MYIQKKSTKRVFANDEIDEVVDDMPMEEGEVEVDPAATDLLFEAEDVAELVAEVTGEPVEVTVEDDSVEFAIGEDVYTVEAEGTEEILECSRKVLKNKRRVSASTSRARKAAPAKRRVAASSRTGKQARKVTRR